MKLSEFLTDIGRPVSYYPGLRKITGSTTATILICQLVYWTGKEQSGDGWIYKSAEELENETGLSYDEQKTARAKLVERGIVKEDYKRLEHKMYFQVQLDMLNELWDIPEHGNAKMGKAELPRTSNMAMPNSLNDLTENTIENNQALPLEWKILSDQPITKEDLNPIEKQATDCFERSLGFGALPWSSTTTWTKLERFVIRVYKANPAVFSEFQAWRDGKGKYKGWTNAKIRQNPQTFIDGALPEFEASRMYEQVGSGHALA